jgi:glycosidase
VGRQPVRGVHDRRAWLAVNPDHVDVNVAAQRDDPDSVLAHYRRLIALRHTEPVVVDGDFTMLLPQDERVYAFTRGLDGTTLLVLGNCPASPRRRRCRTRRPGRRPSCSSAGGGARHRRRADRARAVGGPVYRRRDAGGGEAPQAGAGRPPWATSTSRR